MDEARSQSKVVIISIAIIALILINGSIFYTNYLTKQSEDISSEPTTSVSTSKLDSANASLLQNRIHIDISNQLTPNSSGRENPFVSP